MKALSVDEVGSYLKLSPKIVMQLVRKKKIPGRKWRRVWKFNYNNLNEFLAGIFYSSIKNKNGLAIKYRCPTDWGHPLHILTLKEAAHFLKVSPASLLKDKYWHPELKKIGSKYFLVKERIIDLMTREINFDYFRSAGHISWDRWQKSNYGKEITVLKFKEAANFLEISTTTLKRMINNCQISYVSIGALRRFAKERLVEQSINLECNYDHTDT